MLARNKTYRFVVISLLVYMVVGAISVQKVNAQTYSEYEVKAAYLFNFAKFIDWPDNAYKDDTSPIIIGVIGDDPFGDILEKTTNGRMVKGRKWVIKRFKSVDEITECHILFVAQNMKTRIRDILEQVKPYNTVTIGDQIEEFCQLGGMINFSSRQTKYGFQINKIAADLMKIRISSKLLALAKIVKPYGY